GLPVVVGVDVDPARRDEQTVGVQLLAPGRRDPADLGDPIAVDGHVGGVGGGASTVDHRAAPDHHVMHPTPGLSRTTSMRPLRLALLALVAILVLAACGSSGSK